MKPAKNRTVFHSLLLVVSIAAGFFTVISLRQPWAKETPVPGLWGLLVLAAAAGGYALLRLGTAFPEETYPFIKNLSTLQNRRAGMLFLALSLALTAWIVIRLWPDIYHWQGTFFLWVIALVLAVAGGSLMGKLGENSLLEKMSISLPFKAGFLRPPRLELLLFILILALGIFVRVYRIDQIPSAIYVDETNAGVDALNILEGNHASPFGTGWYETPNGYLYYMAGLFKLFGANWAALKIASLLPAILTLPAVYLLGRLLFGPWTGLISMFLIAISRWHMTMSRWGWNEVMPPIFQVIAVYFLLLGFRGKRSRDFALAGLFTGLVIYTYLSSRLVIATMGLFILYWILADRAGIRESLRQNWRGVAIFSLVFVTTAAPICVTYATHPFTFLNRSVEISIFNEVRQKSSLQPLLDNIGNHVKLIFQQGDPTGRQNLPGEPQTDPVSGVFLAVGTGYSLLHLRDRRRGLLVLWVVLGMAGGYLSELWVDSPNSYRTLTAVPALVLIAADCLYSTANGLSRSLAKIKSWSGRNLAPALPYGLVLACLVAAAAWEINTYFGKQAHSMSVIGSFNLTETRVGQETAEALLHETPVYLSPNFYYYSPLRFLVYGAVKPKTGVNTLENPPYRWIRPEIDLPIPDNGKDALVLLDTSYAPVVGYLSHYYPNAQVTAVPGPDDLPLYLRITVPESDLKAISGLAVRYTLADGTEAVSPAELAGLQGGKAVRSTEWTGIIRLGQNGEYDFASQDAASIEIDGQPWSQKRFLCSGLHELKVNQAGQAAEEGLRLSWVLPGSSSPEPVPAEMLFNARLPEQGLTSEYFDNNRWENQPICRSRTPFFRLSWPEDGFMSAPFSARFTGKLRVDKPGPYHLKIQADDGYRLILDGNVVGEGLNPDQPNDLNLDIELPAGDHPIQLDYFQNGGGNALNFFWTPPGEPETLVPPSALLPE